MEVRTGYRQSNVGVIPEDWEVKLVEEIADVKSGKRLPLGHSLTDNETQHPYIRVIDMFQGGIILNDIRYVPDDVYPAIKNYRIFKDDIFISVAGTLGIVGKIPSQLYGANLTENADRLTNIQCNRDFLLYVFMSSLVQNTIDSERTLGAQPKLALTRIKRFQVPLPSTKAEQIAIATALSDVDTLISSLEKLIAKNRNIKQGAMQLLLTGKKRLPGFTGEWETKKLVGVVNCLDNLRIPLNDSQRAMIPGDIPYCGANGILDYIDDYIIDDNIILVAEDGGYFDEYAYRPIAYKMSGKCWVNNHAHILKAKANVNQDFVFYALVHKNILKYLASGTRAKLNKFEMYKIEIDIPKDKDEQTAIARVISDMDAEMEVLEHKLFKYKLIKQGMMQELLTGKKRLI